MQLREHLMAGGGLGAIVWFFSMAASLFSGYSVSGIVNEAYRLGWFATRWIPAGVMVCCCTVPKHAWLNFLKLTFHAGHAPPTHTLPTPQAWVCTWDSCTLRPAVTRWASSAAT